MVLGWCKEVLSSELGIFVLVKGQVWSENLKKFNFDGSVKKKNICKKIGFIGLGQKHAGTMLK